MQVWSQPKMKQHNKSHYLKAKVGCCWFALVAVVLLAFIVIALER
jgi:hypothetical protein